MNPYKNTAQKLVSKRIVNVNSYIIQKIKNPELRENILNIIEFSKYVAFNKGQQQGKFEFSQKLKELIDVENPDFEDSNKNDF
jgi:hypothetical protein